MFGQDAIVKIWKVEDKGNYSEVSISSSKKNKKTEKYETDFSSNYVRFCGDAHKQRPMKGQKIKITSCGVQNAYEKEGRTQYLKNPIYCVFGYQLLDALW